MDKGIKITVIVPAYNVEKWLPRCIDSILDQTYQNLEIILIDDGSTDGTAKIIDEYALKDFRIVAVHQENVGIVAVRERGIEMATGDYTGFVDGDDEIVPDMYERLLKNALQYDAEISQCGILYCFYDGRKKPMHGTERLLVFNKKDGSRELMLGTQMEPSLCNKLYKTTLLYDSCLDPTMLYNEDLLRNFVVFDRAQNSVYEDFCGYHYWRRADSMSNNNNTVQNGTQMLKTRKLLLENASEDVWQYAFFSYAAALIATYNSLVGNKAKDAVALRKHCVRTLRESKKWFGLLNRGRRYRAYAILYCPSLYNMFFKIHQKRLYAKIKREAEKE